MSNTQAKKIINTLLDQHQGEAVLIVAGNETEITSVLTNEVLDEAITGTGSALNNLAKHDEKFRDKLIERLLVRAGI
jgi:hypothetical protein